MTPEQRHKCMAAIRSKDTKPEMYVRRYLHGMGWRYGLHNRKLPGSPDIVMRRHKTVIFVNGCFWHGHEGCKYSHLPKTNSEFWQTKIDTNRARDERNAEALRKLGWRVIVIWECELKTEAQRERTLSKLSDALKCASAGYLCPPEEVSAAAEPEPPTADNIF